MSRAKQRLRGKGIEANEVSASRMMLVPHTDLVIAPKGDSLFDPRSLDPVDREMAQNMVDRVNAGDTPNRLALLVWERPGCAGLLVGDGHQRTNALALASEMLGGRVLMVLVEFFDGDEKAFLLERARRNDHDRFAKRDKPSVLAFRVRQLTAVGASEVEIVDAMPRGIGPAEVEALTRWEGLVLECKRRFDAREAPIGLLAAVLEVPREEQPAKLDKLVAAGIRTARGAKRAENAERERDGEPRPRRLPPRKLLAVAKAMGSASLMALADGGADFARGMAAGLKFAAGAKTGKLPAGIAPAIKGALAAPSRKP